MSSFGLGFDNYGGRRGAGDELLEQMHLGGVKDQSRPHPPRNSNLSEKNRQRNPARRRLIHGPPQRIEHYKQGKPYQGDNQIESESSEKIPERESKRPESFAEHAFAVPSAAARHCSDLRVVEDHIDEHEQQRRQRHRRPFLVDHRFKRARLLLGVFNWPSQQRVDSDRDAVEDQRNQRQPEEPPEIGAGFAPELAHREQSVRGIEYSDDASSQ